MQHTRRYGLLVFLLLSSLSPLPQTTYAQTAPTVLIQEINWAGSDRSTADEWLTLKNLTSHPLSLAGWTITGAASGGKTITLPADATVNAGGTYLISNYALGEKTILTVTPNMVTADVSLLNENLNIALYDAAHTLIDSFVDEGKLDCGSTKPYTPCVRTITVEAPVVTPPTTPIVETPPVAAAPPPALIITEVVADPIAPGVEYVELANPDPVVTVSLTDWSLQDASGAVTELGGDIPPQSFVVIEEPKGHLNNSEETVTLLAPDGSTSSTVSYGDTNPAPTDGASLSTNGEIWYIAEPTPGTTNASAPYEEPTAPQNDSGTTSGTMGSTDNDNAQNGHNVSSSQESVSLSESVVLAKPTTSVITPTSTSSTIKRMDPPKEAIQTSIDELPDLKRGTRVTLTVTALGTPNFPNKHLLLVEGGELYLSSGDYPDIEAGDLLRVTGTSGTNSGNTRVKLQTADDLSVIGSIDIASTDWETAVLGEAVLVTGSVSERKGSRFLIKTDDGDVPVFIPAALAKEIPKNVTTLTVTGAKRLRSGEEVVQVAAASLIEALGEEGEEAPTAPNTPHAHTDTTVRKKLPLVGGGIFSGTLALVGSWYARAKKLSLTD